MQVVPRGAAGVADVGNDLPGFDLLACGDADGLAVGVEGLQAAGPAGAGRAGHWLRRAHRAGHRGSLAF